LLPLVHPAIANDGIEIINTTKIFFIAFPGCQS